MSFDHANTLHELHCTCMCLQTGRVASKKIEDYADREQGVCLDHLQARHHLILPLSVCKLPLSC